MSVVVIILVVLLLCLLLAPMGRRGHGKLPELRGKSYAHRGLHDAEKPENSMVAFRAALEHGFGIELDVHLLKDGTLAVMHDSSLTRITGCEGMIEDLTENDLKNYRLSGTDETIPMFREVLELFDGKEPMIVELKCARGNHAALTDAACALLKDYSGAWCMESFDPRCVYYLKKHHPEVIRGQLTEDHFAYKNDLHPVVRFLLTHNLLNFLTKPDFVAYRFADRKCTITNAVWQKIWGVQSVSWTLRSKEEYDTAVREGSLPIFENFVP